MKQLLTFILILSINAAFAQKWQWTAQFTDSYLDRSLKLTTDPEGNSIFCGTFKGGLQVWGDDTMFAVSTQNYFIAKADRNGQPLWAIQPITKLEPFGLVGTFYDMDTDPEGNIYLAGTFVDSIRIGEKQVFSIHADSMDNSQMFYAKISPDGDCLYLHNAESTAYSWCTNIAYDGQGGAYIGGTFRDTIEIAGQIFDPGEAFATAYIARLDVEGEVVWMKNLPSISLMRVDQQGTVHFAGAFSDEIDLDGNLVVSDKRRNFYYAQMDGSGEIAAETIHYGSVGSDENSDRITLTDMAINSKNEAVLAGFFKGSFLELGDHPVASIGDKTNFILGLDANGQFVWSHEAGHIDGSWVLDGAVDVDPSDRVYFFSTFENASFICGKSVLSKGRTDLAMAVLEADGSVVFAERYGDVGFDFGYGVACHEANQVSFLGNFSFYMVLGPDVQLYSIESTDVFLARADFGEITSTTEGWLETINVHPNPVVDIFHVEAPFENISYELLDASGRSIFSGKSSNGLEVNMSGLAAGAYMLILQSDLGSAYKKIIKR